mmetsp:Transcript_30491/g.59842  ORF Transcript_30491/g.59842 Transcript_30491/m.59842 type:complete len:90 (+) Transcript_30491:173-442(+)
MKKLQDAMHNILIAGDFKMNGQQILLVGRHSNFAHEHAWHMSESMYAQTHTHKTQPSECHRVGYQTSHMQPGVIRHEARKLPISAMSIS